jgi:hypothetical protein
MTTPIDGLADTDDDYEDVVEFQCPLCQTSVTESDETCPGCGAIFVAPDEDEEAPANSPMETMELDEEHVLTEDYQLDEDVDYSQMDGDDLDAEIAAMEADLGTNLYDGSKGDDPSSGDHELGADAFDLDLRYEDELEEEEEVEEAFGTAVQVSADDHGILEEMSQPNLMERMFQRAGLGMFIAGGAASVLVILWDSFQGQPLNLGVTQWRFLVLSLSMFIVGFVVEMFQAYSLAYDDEVLHIDG